MSNSAGGHYPHELVNMTRDEFTMLIKEAMRDELSACGLLLTTPAERLEAIEDFILLRRIRKTIHGAASKIGYSILIGIISVVGSILYAGFSAKFGK